MSIIKALKKIATENLVSFHVPGHKNGRLISELGPLSQLGYLDTTEIDGTDNLHAPEGAIKETQAEAAVFYGARESFFLVNGTTGGNIAMMYASFQPGDKVLICRDAHKSIFTGMILSQVEPVYISPIIDSSTGISLGISVDQVKQAFIKEPDLKGMALTYPSYHGICSDIAGIEKVVHEAGGLLLVDGAHGAHLNLHNDLPVTAIESGADIVVHSTHKSLPSFTQSSMLHYCTERIDLGRLRMALSMFQSSSPSYLLMASLENAVTVARQQGREKMGKLLTLIATFHDALERQTVFSVLKEKDLPTTYRLDPTKITIITKHVGISGGDLDQRLRKDYGIQCEYGTDSAILFITSIATIEEDMKRLLNALIDISQEMQIVCDVKGRDIAYSYDFQAFELKCGLRPSAASYLQREAVNLQDAVGSMAGDFIVPYPPGIPIVVPGEVISEQVVNFIEEGIRKGYNINGVFIQKELQVNIIRR